MKALLLGQFNFLIGKEPSAGSFFCGMEMLASGIDKNPLFVELDALIQPMGYRLVDVVRNDVRDGIQLTVVVAKGEGDITTDDLAAVYNVVYPRYQVIWKTRDLTLEVSSPGLQRNFRDSYEFHVFTGRMVKVYSTSHMGYLEGRIESCDNGLVTLSQARLMDSSQELGTVSLQLDDIQKAKLTYRWEEKK